MPFPTNTPSTTNMPANELPADAFDALYRAHWSPVLNYMRLRIGPADAQDAAADVFVRAWSRASTFDASAGSVEAWLWTIARNRATDVLRRTDRAPFQLKDDVANDADGADPARALDRDLDARRLLAAVDALPAVDRDLVALRFGAGHSNRTIASMVGRTEGSVAVRLHRALRKVRTALESDAWNQDVLGQGE